MYRLLVLETDRTTPERIFARRMKRERIRRQWRQEDLARQLAQLGLELHPSAIAKMEREPDPAKGIEPRSIRLDEAVVIAQAFQLGVDDMIGDNDIDDLEAERERLEAALDQAREAMLSAEKVRVHAQTNYDRLAHEAQESKRRLAQLIQLRRMKDAAIAAGDIPAAAQARADEVALIELAKREA